MTKDHIPDLGEMDFRMPRRRKMEVGQVIEGTVVMIGSTHVFLDVGAKSEALLDINEVTNEEGELQTKVGDTIEAYIVTLEPEVLLSYALARSQLNLETLEDAKEMGFPVEGKVTALNKGGLEIDLNGARAFCPISQIELGYCEDASAYLEQTLQFKVVEFAENGRNIVVSRRALLEEERQEAAALTRQQLQEGAEFEGEVVTLQPYGAFVDIGGMQGMVHISEISHSRIEHPSEVLQVGQRVKVKVLRVEKDPKHPDRMRIGLSIKALAGDPWEEACNTLTEGSKVEGHVVRLQPFGAFVEIAPGVDGLVHISELSERRISHPRDVVSEGQQVTASILKIDWSSKRISLTLRGEEQSEGPLAVGTTVDVIIDRVKPFGLLVNIKGHGRNTRGLIPIEETGAGHSSNLKRQFPEGKELQALVTSIDENSGKIRLSIDAISEQTEHQDYNKFIKDQKKNKPKSKESMGTFGAALMKALNKDKS